MLRPKRPVVESYRLFVFSNAAALNQQFGSTTTTHQIKSAAATRRSLSRAFANNRNAINPKTPTASIAAFNWTNASETSK
jgi:hypothetical protein